MSTPGNEHERFMREALREAGLAAAHDDVPVGAVVVCEGAVVSRGHNEREHAREATAHAEMLALRRACHSLQRWRLSDCTLYVTLEPCAMCAGALVLARVGTVVYGAADPKAGACGSVLDVIADERLNHRPVVVSGVLEEACGEVLREFFQKKR